MNQRNDKRGFTLIELLVVIAIIAILAAILFPVFAQAREAARTSTSLSNTKQLTLGVQMYVSDYDEVFWPWSWGYYCNGDNQGLPRDSSAFWAPAIYPYVKNTGVYRCPDDVIESNDSWATCSDDGGKNDLFGPANPKNFVSYGVSENLMAWWDTTNKAWHPVKLASINAPANRMLFADSTSQLVDIWETNWPSSWANPNWIAARAAFSAQNFGDWNMPWTAQQTADYFINKYGQSAVEQATRHHGGENVSFVDGHSKYMRWSAMTWGKLTVGAQ